MYISSNGFPLVANEIVLMDDPMCRNGNHFWCPNHRCAACGVLDLNADIAELVAKRWHDELTIREYFKQLRKLQLCPSM